MKNEAKADAYRTAIQNQNLTTSHLLEYTIEAWVDEEGKCFRCNFIVKNFQQLNFKYKNGYCFKTLNTSSFTQFRQAS